MKQAFRYIFATLLFTSFVNIYAQEADLGITGFVGLEGNAPATGKFNDAHYMMPGEDSKISINIKNFGESTVTNKKINYKIYLENPDGDFVQQVYSGYNTFDLGASRNKQFSIVDFGDGSFNPKSFAELNQSGPKYIIPDHFLKMYQNVTPRYKLVSYLSKNDNFYNDTLTKVFRFYMKRQRSKTIISVIYSDKDINGVSDKDIIAGRLNADSLQKGFILYNISEQILFQYDFMDRKNWEPLSIDYTGYSYLFWADGHQLPPNSYERGHISDFMEQSGFKNIAICSEELARELSGDNINKDLDFLKKYLRVVNAPPGNPMGEGGSNEDNVVQGIAIDQDKIRLISSAAENDSYPICGLVEPYLSGEGIAKPAYEYLFYPGSEEHNTAGVVANGLYSTSAYIAIDWRHFPDAEKLVSILMTYLYNNYPTLLNREFHTLFYDKDVSMAKYPGETVNYNLTISLPSVSGFPDSYTIRVENQLNGADTEIKTDSKGKASYELNIPAETEPGTYEVYFTYPRVDYMESGLHKVELYETLKSIIEIKSDEINIQGDIDVCTDNIYEYAGLGPDRNFVWFVKKGGSLMSRPDSSHVKVKWEIVGEGVLGLTQTIINSGLSDSKDYIVNIDESPEAPGLTRRNDTLFSSKEDDNYWFLNGLEVPEEHKDYLLPPRTGTYTVKTLGDNGCFSAPSNEYYVVVGVDEDPENSGIKIYPNPARDYIIIDLPESIAFIREIRLVNAIGTVMIKKNSSGTRNNREKIELGGLLRGAYIIEIECPGIMIRRKIIISD